MYNSESIRNNEDEKHSFLVFLALLAVTLTSCWEISAPEQIFDEADLLGV